MKRLLLLFVPVSLLLVAACGGGLESEPLSQQPETQKQEQQKPDNEQAARPPPPPNDNGPRCGTHSSTTTRACLPDVLAANKPLKIWAEDSGCYGGCPNTTRNAACSVKVTGNVITLDIDVTTCDANPPGATLSCTSMCGRNSVECDVPPLAAGSYRVVGRETVPKESTPMDREVVVQADRGEESCLDSLRAR
jgi:hypothetical protein